MADTKKTPKPVKDADLRKISGGTGHIGGPADTKAGGQATYETDAPGGGTPDVSEG